MISTDNRQPSTDNKFHGNLSRHHGRRQRNSVLAGQSTAVAEAVPDARRCANDAADHGRTLSALDSAISYPDRHQRRAGPGGGSRAAGTSSLSNSDRTVR